MRLWKYTYLLLILVIGVVWLSLFNLPDSKLHLIACDVGQGDAILAVYRETQILIDGGPGKKVTKCLDENIPFWDRQIELVVLTHPQLDHYGGLIEVFKNYKVNTLVASSLDSSSQKYRVLQTAVGGSGVRVVEPTTGMVIRSGLIYLDIVWPTRDFLAEETKEKENKKVLGAYTSSLDPNQFSVVAILRLNEFEALLTGDIDRKVTEEILKTGLVREVDYIKVPHHGSKNGLSEKLLVKTNSKVAVITSGEGNPYGHPHKEVLDLLSRFNIPTYRTDIHGDIKVITDGKSFEVRQSLGRAAQE